MTGAIAFPSSTPTYKFLDCHLFNLEATPTLATPRPHSSSPTHLHHTEGFSPLAIADRVREMIPLPLITVTGATPQKQSVVSVCAVSPAPASVAASGSGKGTDSSYRLLYRGALSLPDSYLLLDGLTFSARLPSHHSSSPYDSPSHSLSQSDSFARDLMHNPLALALESMRGRPSLRFKGTVCLRDVWIDDTGEVYMDIHPFSTLSRVYFENILSMSPLIPASHDMFGPKRTEVGVRISLGDTDGPETTEIIIYGEVSTLLSPLKCIQLPSSSASCESPPLTIRVARLAPAPRALVRMTRHPANHPHTYLAILRSESLDTTNALNRGPYVVKTRRKAVHDEDDVIRRAREVMLHLPGSKVLVNGRARVKDKWIGSAADKMKQKQHDKDQKNLEDSGWTSLELLNLTTSMNRKGKGKARDPGFEREDSESVGSIEATNKVVLKKSAVSHLTNAGIPRTHAEFKDIFGFVYRGAAFALRGQIRTSQLSTHAVDALIEAHVKLYVLIPDIQEASTSGARGALGRRTSRLDMHVDDPGD
ncbi:hypothetical protein BU15DRAFT_75671 [Melanogaster broomeanus]|nr:hypothetical protein BU15DRAFT_75671 [Melanogaster broomeanus]